jgi:hypothetical protein
MVFLEGDDPVSTGDYWSNLVGRRLDGAYWFRRNVSNKHHVGIEGSSIVTKFFQLMDTANILWCLWSMQQ